MTDKHRGIRPDPDQPAARPASGREPSRDSSVPSRMRAATRDQYGPTTCIGVREVSTPAPGPDQVLVEVHAAGVDRGVWHVLTGLPYLLRLAGFGLRRPRQPVLGMDLAGRVVAVGRDVTRLKPGDVVFGVGTGTFAEFALAQHERVTTIPPGITYTAAAAVPVSGLAAWQAVHEIAKVGDGQQLMVLGASGGVGSFCVQLATALGAEVTAVAGRSKLDLVASLGATHLIDYASTDPCDTAVRYDVIVDAGGRTPLAKLRNALAPDGTLVIVGGENGGRWTGGVSRQLHALALSPWVRQRLTALCRRPPQSDSPGYVPYSATTSSRPSVTSIPSTRHAKPWTTSPPGASAAKPSSASGSRTERHQPHHHEGSTPMRPSSAEPTPRAAARLAGSCYLALFFLAIYANFAVRMRLVDVDDPAATTRNLAQSATSVRFAVAAFVVVFVLDVVIAWALYVLFRPTGARQALHAAWFRLVYTVFLGVASVFLFLSLQLATADIYRTGLDPAQLNSTVMLTLEAFDVTWLVGLGAFGVHLILLGRIIISSGTAPALLGWTLMIAGAAYLADTFAHILLANYQGVADLFLIIVAVPSVLGELALTIWLLARAGRTRPHPPTTPTGGPSAAITGAGRQPS